MAEELISKIFNYIKNGVQSNNTVINGLSYDGTRSIIYTVYTLLQDILPIRLIRDTNSLYVNRPTKPFVKEFTTELVNYAGSDSDILQVQEYYNASLSGQGELSSSDINFLVTAIIEAIAKLRILPYKVREGQRSPYGKIIQPVDQTFPDSVMNEIDEEAEGENEDNPNFITIKKGKITGQTNTKTIMIVVGVLILSLIGFYYFTSNKKLVKRMR